MVESPYGIAGPAGLPAARVKVIHDAFKTGLESAEGRKILDQLNQPLNYRTGDEFAQFARTTYAREKTRMEQFKAATAAQSKP